MKKALLLSAVLAVSSVAAQAATLIGFEGVNGTTVNGTALAPGVTQFNLGRSTGLTQNSGGTFNSRDWEEGTDKLSALANNNAIFWGLVIAAANPYDLTDLVIDYDRSKTGPTQMAVDLFINGVFQEEIFSDAAVDNSGSQFEAIDLTSYTNVTGSVFFRLSAWGASSSQGTFDIENDLMFGGNNYGILVKGEPVAPVPLPAGLPLLATAGLAMGMIGRKRRKA